jgi:hypothetical protein
MLGVVMGFFHESRSRIEQPGWKRPGSGLMIRVALGTK